MWSELMPHSVSNAVRVSIRTKRGKLVATSAAQAKPVQCCKLLPLLPVLSANRGNTHRETAQMAQPHAQTALQVDSLHEPGHQARKLATTALPGILPSQRVLWAANCVWLAATATAVLPTV